MADPVGEEDEFKGYITTEFTVWCFYPNRRGGRCTEWLQVCARNKSHAAVDFRIAGWRLTRRHGWMCPECYAHRKGDL